MNNAKNNDTENFSIDMLYSTNILEMNVLLKPSQIAVNFTKENLKYSIVSKIEGKCIEEGYVQPDTVHIQTYSSGTLKGEYVEFAVVFECKTFNPAEGSWIKDCKVQSVTKAGIHANVFDSRKNNPATIFIVKEHFENNKYFNEIKEDDLITIKVIGSRFELNDPCVEILGNLMNPQKK